MLAAMFAASAHSQPGTTADYPNRPVRIVVPFVAGGGTDIVARAVAQKLGAKFSRQFVVDNRPAAAGTVGLDIMRSAAPDGYTLMMITGSVVAGQIFRKVPLTELAPIAQVSSNPYVMLATGGLPAKNLAEVVALARNKPNSIAYGSSGVGGMQHMIGILLAQKTAVELLHVPYKGGGQVIAELISGQVQLAFLNPLGAEAYIREGRVRALAVTTLNRSASFPTLPAMSEMVPGFDVNNWYAIVAPAGLGKSLVDVLNNAILAVLSDPDIRSRLEKEGADLASGPPAALAALMAAEKKRWSEVIKSAKVKAD